MLCIWYNGTDNLCEDIIDWWDNDQDYTHTKTVVV
jgi:hypothetical protein